MNEAVRDEPLEQYIEAMKELWAYEPFQLLLTTFKDRVPNINSVEQTRTVEELFFRSGQMDIIRTLENLQDNIGIIETDYLQSLEPQDYTVASGLYSSWGSYTILGVTTDISAKSLLLKMFVLAFAKYVATQRLEWYALHALD